MEEYLQQDLPVGTPALVTLDLEEGLILIDATDFSLSDLTYQVFINCHVAISEIV